LVLFHKLAYNAVERFLAIDRIAVNTTGRSKVVE
jgi:hypothetical protein